MELKVGDICQTSYGELPVCLVGTGQCTGLLLFDVTHLRGKDKPFIGWSGDSRPGLNLQLDHWYWWILEEDASLVKPKKKRKMV